MGSRCSSIPDSSRTTTTSSLSTQFSMPLWSRDGMPSLASLRASPSHFRKPAHAPRIGRIFDHAKHRGSHRRKADKIEHAPSQSADAVAAIGHPLQQRGHAHRDDQMGQAPFVSSFWRGIFHENAMPGRITCSRKPLSRAGAVPSQRGNITRDGRLKRSRRSPGRSETGELELKSSADRSSGKSSLCNVDGGDDVLRL